MYVPTEIQQKAENFDQMRLTFVLDEIMSDSLPLWDEVLLSRNRWSKLEREER